jgi:hypothetical protein
MGLFPAVLSSAARFAANRAKQLGLGGDLKGDGYQNGGALVVGKGGETLLHYVQEGAPDHVSNADVLKVTHTNNYAQLGAIIKIHLQYKRPLESVLMVQSQLLKQLPPLYKETIHY